MSRERIEEIDEKIAALQEKRDRLTKKNADPWPRRITIYVHASKESNYEDGEELGLSEKSLEKFAYACCEVALKLEVNEDGSSHIVSVDGKKLQKTQSIFP